MKYITTIGEQEFTVEIQDEEHIKVDGKEYEVNFDSISEQPMYSLLLDGRSHEAYVYHSEKVWQVLLFGRLYPVHVEDERERRLRLAAGSKVSERTEYYLKAPMPGLVVNIPVADGQEVGKGDVLVVFESMKMQNELRSPRPGRVIGLRVAEGDSVDQHTILLSIV
jgi:acetyl/propionyl-CoA carboxylase alpha subunit